MHWFLIWMLMIAKLWSVLWGNISWGMISKIYRKKFTEHVLTGFFLDSASRKCTLLILIIYSNVDVGYLTVFNFHPSTNWVDEKYIKGVWNHSSKGVTKFLISSLIINTLPWSFVYWLNTSTRTISMIFIDLGQLFLHVTQKWDSMGMNV